MMRILTLGEEVLRKQCPTVETVDESISELVRDMVETMYGDDGVGLAAPQIGVEKQIFVCHAHGDKARVFINPQIIFTSQEMATYEEGCLSIPGVYADIERPAAITVQAINERGRPFKLDAEGMLARVIQHEMDHLNGVLFIDHLDETQREKLLKVYSKQR